MARTRTAAPSQKTQAGAVAAAVTVIFVWILHQYAHTDIPDYVSASITAVIGFLASYVMPPGDDETVPTGASVTMEHVDVATVDTTDTGH